MLNQYFFIFIVIIISLSIGFILYFITYFFSSKSSNFEKISAYECGFDPFSDTKKTFDVRYYLVSILFIIFDLEISFLFPWSVVFLYIGVVGYIFILIFLFILTFGFVYEWLNNALDWQLHCFFIYFVV